MKNYLFVFLLVLWCGYASAQNTISLQDCYNAAKGNYPLAQQKQLFNNLENNSLRNINTAYLPQAEINAMASYQSNVPELPIKLPNLEIPALPKDRYQFTLDVRENIYDGGLISAQREIQKNSTQIEQQKIEIELYKLQEKINQYYFSILLADENDALLQILQNDLNEKLKKAKSAVKNGALLPGNQYILEAEILKNHQRIMENNANKSAAINNLKLLTNLPIDLNTKLQKPALNFTPGNTDISSRQEITLYSLQQKNASNQQRFIQSKTLPKLSAFGQFGYGRPGLNLFAVDFEPFYVVGLRANWNFSAFYTSKRENEMQQIQQQIIEKQKETFTQNIQAVLNQQQAEIDKLEQSVLRDYEIISLRKKITSAAESQLNNGTITYSDFMTERNAQLQAELSLQMHQIQLLMNKINYQTTLGK
ncbi:MAG: TolC family protein [Bacteroidia bacterium]